MDAADTPDPPPNESYASAIDVDAAADAPLAESVNSNHEEEEAFIFEAEPPARILPWYRLYRGARGVVDTIWLGGIILRHAAVISEYAQRLRAIEEAEEPSELLRFVEVRDEHDGNSDDESAGSVASDESLSEHLNSGSRRVFNTPLLRPRQQQTVQTILRKKSCGGKIIVVDRTGGGKSLILHMTSIAVAGISLVIVPLLALTANQLERINQALQTCGATSAVHIDDTTRDDTRNKVIPRINDFDYNSSSTLLILCSPQQLAENIAFREAMIRAYKRQILRLVAIDEAHLYAMHGRSFRESIRVLRDHFFAVICSTATIKYAPLILAMTTTKNICCRLFMREHWNSLAAVSSPIRCHTILKMPTVRACQTYYGKAKICVRKYLGLQRWTNTMYTHSSFN